MKIFISYIAMAAVLASGPFIIAEKSLSFAAGVQDEEKAEEKKSKKWDTTKARGETRQISFETDEGTFMSVDVSPDGQWLVFDMLASVYRMPIGGGEAENLTADSGVAVNYHPKFSPDGKSIAFISDRKGQDNLWVMDADGSNPRQVNQDLKARHYQPEWSADSQYLYVRFRGLPAPGAPRKSGLYMFHNQGGKGLEMVGSKQSGASWPTASVDGKYLYFQVRAVQRGPRDALKGNMQIRRLNIETGKIMAISKGVNAQQSRASSGGAAAPEVSPDGRYVAFIRRIPDGTISYKGRKFGPRTALWLRDQQTGAERIIMDPVEQDMIEGMKTLRILPGYSFTPDGKSIVISQGGKFRKLDIASGDVTIIPFNAKVDRTISGQAYKKSAITDGPFEAKMLRWYAGSPDGKSVAFQAAGKIWLQGKDKDGNDTDPKRLTNDNFKGGEFAPAWSPDGRWLAFTAWDDTGRGSLWKVRSNGRGLRKLNTNIGEYIHPDWSADGNTIVVARGANVTARGRSMAANPWWEIVSISATGKNETVIGRIDKEGRFGGSRSQLPRPHFGPDGRVFYLAAAPTKTGGGVKPTAQLESVSLNDTGEAPRVHASFAYSDEAAISPDGSQLAFLEGDNIYLTPFPYGRTAKKSPFIRTGKGSKLPVKQLTKTGGLYPNWRDGNVLEYGSAKTYFAHDVTNDDKDYSASVTTLSLTLPRAIPTGRVAFTNARIITMRGTEVLENATIVVKGARIDCLGKCDTSSAAKVVDATGKTIIPGFVDMHAHHFREYQGMLPNKGFENAIYMAYGVTTTLDNSMWSQNVFSAAEMVKAGTMLGPRTFSTGDPLYNSASPRQNLITSYDVAEENIKRLKSWGAVSIKQYLQPRRNQRQWISDVARKEGLMVTSEGSDLAYNMGMIMDGQTAFEHPMSYMPMYSDMAKFFGKAKAVYSPTFIVGGSGAWNEEYFWNESSVWSQEKQRRWMPWRQLVNTIRPIKRADTDYSFPLVAQGMADIIAEGGYGSIGSHGQQHGIGSHWEIWMAAAGTGNHGALDVATRQGAYFLGVEDDLGSLEAGKLADLLVLNSNPIDNIRNTMDLNMVMKGGVLYNSDTLDQVWPKAEPFGPYYWVDEEIYRTGDIPVDNYDKK
jgi:Tol biopolymer transport system component